jgi:two-component system NtrC family sensor kinase
MTQQPPIPAGTRYPGQHTQWALEERIKELTCLHGVARAVGRPGADPAAILEEVLTLLPPAWQHPHAARARIRLNGETHATPGFERACAYQSADIVVRGEVCGKVEVAYIHPKPAADEGPFLKEERELLNSVAYELASLAERIAMERERAHLQDQLRHADRLATIGQLAAGVAHELNEPLNTTLGFAQLCRKHPGLPAAASADLEKIIAATLHARETVRKLMLFARERPPAREWISLQRMVDEGIAFVESRAQKSGVEIRRDVSPDLPEILADPNQLTQVVVNLAVNAIQAMPAGGTLGLELYREGSGIVLAVEDNGEGMPPQVAERIFEPFFTTKGVGEGTGLGLSVVHGIVTGHGGTIRVKSSDGHGSRFEVWLPVEPPDVAPPATAPRP